jgi:hypothetical protein
VTLVIGTLIIAAAALALIRVIIHLTAALRSLRAVTGGVGVIADKTSTVGPVLESVNASLAPVRDFTAGI